MEKTKNTKTQKEKGIIEILFDLFRSLKLTIFLFILLALLSILGTLIRQNAPSMEYVQRYGDRLYEVLNFFSLFDMYHSWWFSAILLLLVINLIACSLHRLPGVWRQVFRDSSPGGLEDSMLRTLSYVERVPNLNPGGERIEEEIRLRLKRRFKNSKRIEAESAITLFSEKGKFSRLGLYITHLSLLIILIGGLVGSLYGFRGHVEILEGETVNQIFLHIKEEEFSKPIDFSIRCDDFKVTYYDLPGERKHVKDYISVLTVLENGEEVLKKTIEVNHPLHYKGLTFYQSTYGAIHEVTIGVQGKDKKEKTFLKALQGTTIPIPNSNAVVRLLKYAPQVHNFGEGAQIALFRPNQEPRTYWVLKDFPKFDEQKGDEFILTFEGVSSREYTGLQVTKDPGVWVVWIGCTLMILGLIVSFFFSHQRVWVRIPKGPVGEIVLAGSTSKNRLGFEKAFGQLVEGVRSKSSEFGVRS